MNKFKIHLKIEGLELSVEGSRDDVSQMTQAVSQQLSGLLSPAAEVVEGEVVDRTSLPAAPNLPALSAATPPKKKRKSSTTKPSTSSSTTQVTEAVDWKHDTAKWGSPQQGWTTADKAVWLLFVHKQEMQLDELSGKVIAATFNKHFKQSGTIQTGTTNRDLGKLKTANKDRSALISENTTVTPSNWFLTTEGDRYATDLVAKARGIKPQN